MAYRRSGKNLTADVCRCLHHAPRVARRADATALAGTGHEVVVPTIVTPRTVKAERGDAALQMLANSLADIGLGGVVVALTIKPACAGRLNPRLEVLGDSLVEPSLL